MKRLKDKKVINSLFDVGKTISGGLVIAKVLDSNSGFLFTVSKKKFRRAVDRNKIKRLMRESIKDLELNKTMAFIFIGDKISSFKEIKESIDIISSKL